MSKFKPGTLVMKIGMGDPSRKMSIPIGSIGEIKEYSSYDSVPVDCVIVFFPAYPSWSFDQYWAVEHYLLVPLSDPDMDVTETQEEDLGEFV